MTGRCRRLAAYLIVVAAGVAGFVRLEAVSDEVRREALRRDYVSCVNANEARGALRQFVRDIVDMNGERSEGEARAVALADESFRELPCPPEPED